MKPEEALDEARRRAAARAARSGGRRTGVEGLRVAPVERADLDRLLDWAVIEPDLRDVRSTRRFGAPITWVKRGLVRALRQWDGEARAQQTRFNLAVAQRLAELEERQREERDAPAADPS